MNKINMVCIECPRGCTLTAEVEADKSVSVSGNFCIKGKKYAENELTAPVRTVTSTVRLADGEMLPVKTDREILKDKVFEIIKTINSTHPQKPIKIGDILIKNIEGEANLIASKNAGGK